MPRSSSASWWKPILHNRLLALVLLMMTIVPLIAAPLGRLYPGAEALTYELFAIVLLAVAVWSVRQEWTKESALKFLKTGPNALILLFLALIGISCVLSPHKSFSIQETLRIGAGMIVYFVVAYQFRRSEHLTRLSDGILFLAGATALGGFIEYSQSSGQFSLGLMGDHQLLGSILMVLLPIVAAIALTEKSPGRLIAAQVVAVLTTAALLLAHSRSAWMGALAGLITVVVLICVGMQKSSRHRQASLRRQYLMPVLLLAASVGFFLLLWPQTGTILERTTSLTHFSTDSTWSGRQTAWKGAARMIEARPITGFGVGLYSYYQRQYTGVGNPVDTLKLRPSLSDEAHNVYLQTAAELGVPGLLLWLAIPILFVATGVRRYLGMDPGVRKYVLLGCIAAIVACTVDAFSSPSWQLGQVSLFYWLILGLGVNCMQPSSGKTVTIRAASPGKIVWARTLAVAGTLALCAFLPTVAVAVQGAYTNLISITLTPKGATIRAGQAQIFTVTAHFGDSMGNITQDVDVSEDPNTKYSFTTNMGQIGALTGPNNRSYQSVSRRAYIVTMMASYTGGTPSSTKTDTATLNVVR